MTFQPKMAIAAVSSAVLLTACFPGGNMGTPETTTICELPADFSAGNFDFVLEWGFRNNNNAGHSAISVSGQEVRLGPDSSGLPGHVDSKAISTLDCDGSGNNCHIEVSVGTRVTSGTFKDGEKLTVALKWGNGPKESFYGEFDHTGLNTHKINTNTCQGISVEIGMTEVNSAGVQTRSVATVRRQCIDC